MCLLLYIASSVRIPEIHDDDISVEPIDQGAEVVKRLFSLPEVRFIGAPGCSCTFPHVVAEQPIEWFEGMFNDEGDREEELSSVRALFALLDQLLSTSSEVQMYPVWNGAEGENPKGTIEIGFESLEPRKFFFNEQFVYRVTRQRSAV